MKKLLLAALLSLLPSLAFAQCSGIFPANYFCGNLSATSNIPRAQPIASLTLSSSQFDALFGSTQGSMITRNASAWVALTPGTSGYVLTSLGAGANLSWTAAGSGTVTSVGAGTGITLSVSPITASGSVSVDKASAANFYTAASNKVITTDIAYTSEITISPTSASLTLDFDTFIHAVVSPVSLSQTSMTCSNVRAGKAGLIRIYNKTAAITAWCTEFKWASGTGLSSSSTNNAIDSLSYFCSTSSFCTVTLTRDVR